MATILKRVTVSDARADQIADKFNDSLVNVVRENMDGDRPQLIYEGQIIVTQPEIPSQSQVIGSSVPPAPWLTNA